MGRLAANVLAQGSFLESRFEGPGDSRGVLPVSSTWRVFLGSIFRLEIKTPAKEAENVHTMEVKGTL